MVGSLNKSLAFLLGFGFAFLPSFGPIIALPLFFINRWKLGRLDGLWALTALVAGFSFSSHNGLSGFTFGAFQIIGPWLVYRAFRQLPGTPFLFNQRWAIAIGILSGFSLTSLLGWLQIEQLNFAYKTLNQAITWTSPPALYGHTMLVLGGLIAVLLAKSPLRLLGLTLSAFGILISGSREAALAWVFMMVALFFIKGQRKLTRRLPELGLFLLMLALVAGLGAPLGWGRLGFLLDIAPNLSSTTNLVQGSEIANGDW